MMENKRTIIDAMFYGITTINENIVTLSENLAQLMDECGEIRRILYTVPTAAGTDMEKGGETTQDNEQD